jgi:heme iron utilization protein
MEERKDVLRTTDAEAIRLAKTLMRTARHGALAVLDPESGVPLASRVGVATDMDGSPLLLVSGLAAHTAAMVADPRCSLLLGEPGKGDAMAHPRITLICGALRLERGTEEHKQAERRYLNHNPKAKLYASLGDFSIFRLTVHKASLNGGFGRAYLLDRDDVIAESVLAGDLISAEQRIMDHMNSDHLDAVALYAQYYAGLSDAEWSITGVDADGLDIAANGEIGRVFFSKPVAAASEIRPVLVEMAKEARNPQKPEF